MPRTDPFQFPQRRVQPEEPAQQQQQQTGSNIEDARVVLQPQQQQTFTYLDGVDDDRYEPTPLPPTMFDHLLSRAKANPVINMGLLATIYVMGLMVRGRHDKLRLNQLARWRLGCQGFTLAAVLQAMYVDESKKQTSPYPWDWHSMGPPSNHRFNDHN